MLISSWALLTQGLLLSAFDAVCIRLDVFGMKNSLITLGYEAGTEPIGETAEQRLEKGRYGHWEKDQSHAEGGNALGMGLIFLPMAVPAFFEPLFGSFTDRFGARFNVVSTKMGRVLV
jgi:MFS family permease